MGSAKQFVGGYVQDFSNSYKSFNRWFAGSLFIELQCPNGYKKLFGKGFLRKLSALAIML